MLCVTTVCVKKVKGRYMPKIGKIPFFSRRIAPKTPKYKGSYASYYKSTNEVMLNRQYKKNLKDSVVSMMMTFVSNIAMIIGTTVAPSKPIFGVIIGTLGGGGVVSFLVRYTKALCKRSLWEKDIYKEITGRAKNIYKRPSLKRLLNVTKGKMKHWYKTKIKQRKVHDGSANGVNAAMQRLRDNGYVIQ